MDDKVKFYAGTLYDQSLLESANILSEALHNLLLQLAARQNSADRPLSGPEIQAIIMLYVRHIERCMDSKLESYHKAFDEAKSVPTDEELQEIWRETEATKDLQKSHSTRALQQFMKSRGVDNNPTESIIHYSGRGHDRVLQKWKVWAGQIQLRKAAHMKKAFSDPYPTNLNDVQVEIDYWASRQHEGQPGSNFDQNVRNRLEQLRHLHDRYSRQGKTPTGSPGIAGAPAGEPLAGAHGASGPKLEIRFFPDVEPYHFVERPHNEVHYRMGIYNHGPGPAVNVQARLVKITPCPSSPLFSADFPYVLRGTQGSVEDKIGYSLNPKSEVHFELLCFWGSSTDEVIVDGIDTKRESRYSRFPIQDKERWRMEYEVSCANADMQKPFFDCKREGREVFVTSVENVHASSVTHRDPPILRTGTQPSGIARLKKYFVLGAVPIVPLLITFAFGVQAVNPLIQAPGTIWWFSLAACYAAVAVFMWEEISSAKLRTRFILTISLVVVILLFLAWALNWVVHSADDGARSAIGQYVIESRASASRAGTSTSNETGPPLLRAGSSRLAPPIKRTAKVAVMIPFDTAPDAFPIPLDENPDDPMYRTYIHMNSLARWGLATSKDMNGNDLKPSLGRIKPVSVSEAPSFLGKLLQYYILTSIDELERSSITVAIGYPSEAKPGIDPPDSTPYPNGKLFQELANNQFFQAFRGMKSPERMSWEASPIKMPNATEIRIRNEEKPDRYVVRIDRSGYFSMEYVIENFGGTGVGNVPKHFITPYASTTMQWAFFVTMRYAIQRRTEEDFHPEDYALWADALFAGLNQKLSFGEASTPEPDSHIPKSPAGAGRTIIQTTNAPHSANVVGNNNQINLGSAPRVISQAVEADLISRLVRQGGKVHVSINTRNQDADTNDYAIVWCRILHAAGWTNQVSPSVTIAPNDVGEHGVIPIPKGIHIYAKTEGNTLAMFLKTQLKEGAGVDSYIEKDGALGESELMFFVGAPER